MTIIFDLDNTLIPWKDNYINIIHNNFLKHNCNVSFDVVKNISDLIDEYEKVKLKLDKNDLLMFINSNIATPIASNILDLYIDSLEYCVVNDEKIVTTMEYLAQKYSIYVITNWFTESQKKRLARVGILKYIQEVYGADINYYKPNEQAFDVILKKYPANKCISIGDSLEKDILPAKNLGMQVIWKTTNNSNDIKTIRDISDLKNIL